MPYSNLLKWKNLDHIKLMQKKIFGGHTNFWGGNSLRFSKDTLAYLFKDFNYVELFPYRGRISSSLHMLFGNKWKQYMEKTKLNHFLDKFIPDDINHKQCSGFYFVVKK